MFGMEIRLNEQYIAKKGQYKIEDLIATIDRLFNHYGFRKKVEDRSLYYLGNNHKDDYGKFFATYLILHRNRWFMENITLQHFLENDDNQNEEDGFYYSDYLKTLLRKNKLNGLDPAHIEKYSYEED